jgi:hypothetical protein
MREEIPPELWQPFLDDLSRVHAGELVTVEIARPTGGVLTEALKKPLVGVTADRAGREPEVAVMLGGDDGELTHLVQGVRSVRILRESGGAEKALEIEGREGEVTVVRM